MTPEVSVSALSPLYNSTESQSIAQLVSLGLSFLKCLIHLNYT